MLQDIVAYAAAAELTASPLRFGAWLRDSFGTELVAPRRARERAVRALELGPPVVIEPIATVAIAPSAVRGGRAGRDGSGSAAGDGGGSAAVDGGRRAAHEGGRRAGRQSPPRGP